MKKITSLAAALFISRVLSAQKDAVEAGPEGGSNWYGSPWLWVVAAAVFILLLVALTRGENKKDI